MRHTATTELDGAAIAYSELRSFLDRLPEDAVNASCLIDVEPRMEGQRNPYTIGYRITARWES